MYSTNGKAPGRVKKINMIRICFTVIAYIISFLSHSNELEATRENEIFSERQSQVEYLVKSDSLREECYFDKNDLN